MPQSGLSLPRRSENIRHALEVVEAACVRDRDVILVDDLMTTGATASACRSAVGDGCDAGARAATVPRCRSPNRLVLGYISTFVVSVVWLTGEARPEIMETSPCPKTHQSCCSLRCSC